MSVEVAPKSIGLAVSRVDGVLKVGGEAKYAAEFSPKGFLTGCALSSSISRGKITAMDISAARGSPGVRVVITHENALKLKSPKPHQATGGGIQNEKRLPLSDAVISYGGQYIAFVVADTIEQARHACSLIKVQYDSALPVLRAEQARSTGEKPKHENGEAVQIDEGDVTKALASQNLVIIERIYETPVQTHNPIEPSATVAEWIGEDKLTLHDATQHVKGCQDILAQAFDLKRENVTVISPFVGGAFGCKGAVWPHVILTAMAARMAGAPVKFALARQDMFSSAGHRTPTTQTIALAATREGQLQAIRHRVETVASPVGEFIEHCGGRSSAMMYASPSINVEETVYKVNVSSPTFMRAPGECPGTYALESAMDELAYELKMDPMELRLRNYCEDHPVKKKPFSAKYLREAYKLGAEKFGWSQRNPIPRSMQKDGMLIGWGMATATYPAHKMAAIARITMQADGTTIVRCAAHDIGTGAYTALAQISAQAIGVPLEKVRFDLGNSSLPAGPVAGGSNTTATVGSAVYEAAHVFHLELGKLAVKDRTSPLHGEDVKKIFLAGAGKIGIAGQPGKTESFESIMRKAGKPMLEAEGSQKPSVIGQLMPSKIFQSFGAQFCEVQIDPDLPFVRVTRFVSVMNCGQIINPKTSRSQIQGGIVMGIGMALEEETRYDPKTGVPTTRNLADYHVPVNADIPDIDVHFVGEPDYAFNPMGSRGLGEIGNTGTAAAVANAVYHATGKRVRDLPITLDKLLS